jgi:putative aldouronate transport system substrate-binding protein
MAKMHTLAEEGLISSAFINSEDVKTQNYLEQDLGFMHYDYNQTQTLYNKTALDNEAGEKYMAVMVPVARWYDGANEEGVYMRFTESWRSVKTDGWGISKAGVAGNDDKLYAALALIDYAYSEEGTILMSYGPDAFIKTNADGSYVTFLFNGKEMPEIADATREELWAKASGNYTNYARQFLGSTLSFMKSQAFEYQCTHDVGREGAGKISTAIALGTIKHPLLAVADNPWYTSVPTVLPTTKNENQELGQFTDLNSKFQAGKGQENVLVDIIAVGFTAEGMSDPEEAAETVADSWKGEQYLIIKEGAWEALLDYYEEITE